MVEINPLKISHFSVDNNFAVYDISLILILYPNELDNQIIPFLACARLRQPLRWWQTFLGTHESEILGGQETCARERKRVESLRHVSFVIETNQIIIQDFVMRENALPPSSLSGCEFINSLKDKKKLIH